MARGHIHLRINGRLHQVAGEQAFINLADYLRLSHGLVGTKIVCSEGDCGACTVLVARPNMPPNDGPTDGQQPGYRPVDACITWMFQLDHADVVTVEGLADGGALHPVQQAMVDGHGSQCGFCTPGFVVAMTGLVEDARAAGLGALDRQSLRRGLVGNLCRCTGYQQIIDAGRRVDPMLATALADRYPAAPAQHAWQHDEPCVHVMGADGRAVLMPSTLAQAIEYLDQHPGAKVISGATDAGVHLNKGLITLDKVLYLGGINELRHVEARDGQLSMGAAATWTDVLGVVREALPQFAAILERFGAPQIRHMATIGGNIINASPIADCLPLLLVTEARLRLVSVRGERRVNISDFYLGYKKLDLQPGELLAEVELPLPTAQQQLRLYKVSKRRDLDIATFTAAILLTMNEQMITDAKLAYGGVGPVVLRLPRTEAFLAGKVLSESLMLDAGAIARDEITPITDVRASAEYRFELAETILAKAYYDIAPAEAVV